MNLRIRNYIPRTLYRRIPYATGISKMWTHGLILIQISHKTRLKLETFTVTLIKGGFFTHYLNKQRGVQTWGTFMTPSYLFFKKSKQ